MPDQIVEFDYSLGPLSCIVKCQRLPEGTWQIWCKILGPDDPEECEYDLTTDIKTAQEFVEAFCGCGAEFGFESQLEDLEGAIPRISQQDPVLAVGLAALLRYSPPEPAPPGHGRLQPEAPWFVRLQSLLVRRRLEAALRLLNDIVERELPLLDLDREVLSDRRIAWLCRIDLLKEKGRLTEALAWSCLECELHPDNVVAQMVKEELKRLTSLGEHGWNRPPGRQSVVLWEGVAGMRPLRAELQRDVIVPLLNPEQYRRYRVPLPNGILLFGPPGCGKTHIARTLAKLINLRFFEVSPSDLASIYVHGTQGMIRDLFRRAEENQPALIFFDEFDAFVPSRDDQIGHHYGAEVNEFLIQLNECSSRGILVVAATNHAEKVDRAVLRPGRIDKQFFVGPPDLEARVELFRLYLADRPLAGVDCVALGAVTDCYTPAEIREVVNQAARWALEAGVQISQVHLQRAISERTPSLQPSDASQRRIGFI